MSSENRMRYLVTGGAGFLGSHLSRRLVSEGHEVVCLDNLYTGTKENIRDLFQYPNFEFIRHDITVPIALEVDAIMNLACPASPVHYQKFPVQTTRTSVLGALNVLELAEKLHIKVFQASTSEVYGDPNISPQSEVYWGNVNPIGVRACYDEGKRVAETLFFDYQRQYGTNIKIARIFNTYGPNMALNDGRVVSNFILQALRGEPITIYGDGSQTRSFCFVDDLIEGFLCLMNTPMEITGPINLGNPNEFSMLELAEKVISKTNSKSELIFQELPSDDPKQRKPDIRLASEILSWTPVIELDEGLQRTIQYFEKMIS